MKKKTAEEIKALSPMDREIYETKMAAHEREIKIRAKYRDEMKREMLKVAAILERDHPQQYAQFLSAARAEIARERQERSVKAKSGRTPVAQDEHRES